MKIIRNVLTKTRHAGYPLVRFFAGTVPGFGKMTVAVNDEGLCWLGMTDSALRLKQEFPSSVLMGDEKLEKLAHEVKAVWQGKKKTLSLPVVLSGTGFQMLVWNELLKIRSGRTLTYQDIARKIGRPKAVRAVGSAVGANPVTLLVPCHRVLSKSGAKLKFGWGPDAKRMLLEAEGVKV
jgi:methylated-DNA-[protein]-cysteine S-methyltransferase